MFGALSRELARLRADLREAHRDLEEIRRTLETFADDDLEDWYRKAGRTVLQVAKRRGW